MGYFVISSLIMSSLSIERFEDSTHQIRYKVTVPLELFESHAQTMMRQKEKRHKIPNFRPGMAPQETLEKYFGYAVRQELLGQLPSEAWKVVLERETVPDLSESPSCELEQDDQRNMVLIYTCHKAPQAIEQLALDHLSIEEPTCEITTQDIQNVLEKRCVGQTKPQTLDVARPIMAGDWIRVTKITAIKKGQDALDPILKEEKNLWVSFETLSAEEQNLWLGKAAGETFDQNFVIPRNKKVFGKWVGKQGVVRVTIQEVAGSQPHEVDDAWAQSIGFQTLSDSQENTRKELEEQAKTLSHYWCRKQIMDLCEKQHVPDLPHRMVEQEKALLRQALVQDLESQLEKPLQSYSTEERAALFLKHLHMEEETFEKGLEKMARRRLTVRLVFEAYARQKEIQLTDRDIQQEIIRRSQGKTDAMMHLIQEANRDTKVLQDLRSGALEFKVIHALLEQAEKKPTPISWSDLEDRFEKTDWFQEMMA